MPNPYARPDGVSQLTEMMRQDPVAEPPAERPRVDPETRRRRRRARIVTASVAFLVVAALGAGYVWYALTAPIAAASLEAEAPPLPETVAADIPMSQWGAMAVSVAGGDEYFGPEAGGIWMSSGGDEPRPIASISKLITALVVLEQRPLSGPGDPGPTLTFGAADYALYDKYYVLGASIAEMPRGSSMSLHNALEAMLIVSACNYAEAVSTWAFGSQAAFLRATRTWLANNGLPNTTIVEPTGIDPRNTSTPADMIALGKIAHAHPVISEIAKMTSLRVPNIPPMTATNTALGRDGITGIKTGTLEEHGSNLLFSATLDVGLPEPLEVIGIVLGAEDGWLAAHYATAFLDGVRSGFTVVTLGTRGTEVGRYETPWGESSAIILGENASVRVWSDAEITSTFEVTRRELTAGEFRETVGEMTWTVEGETISVPLVLASEIEPPDVWWRLTHAFELGG
jgi:serine-type D-Ala-D-Ala carboxypeptidase (penicillin-binding protein 5/6)